MTKPKNMPVRDYDQRLVAIWLDSAHRIVKLPVVDETGKPDLDLAITMRHELYRLRVQMGREAHPDYSQINRVKVSLQVTFKDGTQKGFSHKRTIDLKAITRTELLFTPRAADKSFEASLAGAGYKEPEAPKF